MFNNLLEGILDLILPRQPQCPLCGQPHRQRELCPACRALMDSYSGEPFCAQCGRFLLPYHGASKSCAGICPECSAGSDWPFALNRSVGPYEGVLQEAVQRLKYGNARGLAETLGGLMAEVFGREKAFKKVEIILPVPLSGKKLRQRGYNQSELLARELSPLVKVPVAGRVLQKIMDTPAQVGLSRQEREENLTGAFKARPGAVEGKTILVLDDVFTTGSTLSAVTRALKAAGAGEVLGLTVAAGRYR